MFWARERNEQRQETVETKSYHRWTPSNSENTTPKINNAMTEIHSNLNSLIKRNRRAEWIKTQNPLFCCLQEAHLTGKGWKNYCSQRGPRSKHCLFLSSYLAKPVQIKLIRRNKEGHLILIKNNSTRRHYSLNISTPNSRAPCKGGHSEPTELGHSMGGKRKVYSNCQDFLLGVREDGKIGRRILPVIRGCVVAGGSQVRWNSLGTNVGLWSVGELS